MLAGSAIILLLVALGIGSYLGRPRNDRLPAPDSATYQETARRFYRGLAALDVGLLDDAATEFARATELVPAEPASWANLGLTHVRRGAIEEATNPLNQAQALAPESADIALLQGSLAGAAGRLEEAIAHLRRAADLHPDGLRARFALAGALERAGGPDGDRQARQFLDEILARQENLSVRLERARLAAKLADGPALRDSVRPPRRTCRRLAADRRRAIRRPGTGGRRLRLRSCGDRHCRSAQRALAGPRFPRTVWRPSRFLPS